MNCYVASQLSNAVFPPELNKENTLFYPESRMTTYECFTTSQPKDFHIVTDCPFLVSLYDNEEVFIWEKNKWIHPKSQTFGTSYNIIIDDVFNYPHTIPQAIIDGKITNCMGFNRKKSVKKT
ncbi:MAG: hypothetical protein PHF86_01475 [Candidatus Nanoarchaeia archaeon]|nr:hypothetical protein [Candidatus Nanoarchaeia archaeon]